MNYQEYERIMPLIEKIIKDNTDSPDTAIDEMNADLRDSVKGINIVLFGQPDLQGITTKNQWQSRIGTFVKEQLQRKNQIDRDFYGVIMLSEMLDEKDLESFSKKSFLKLDEVTRQRYIKFYHDFSHFWGELGSGDEVGPATKERICILKEHRQDLIWLYERLCDYRSKRVLSNMLNNWINFDISLITGMKENCFVDYFDPDVFSFSGDEVIVDLGAYIGDTVTDYANNIGKYKKIYCYEITSGSVEKMKDNLKLFMDIEIRNYGVSDSPGIMHLTSSDVRKTANRLTGNEGEEVEVVTLDEDIKEKITFLKMDIEGAEKSAIKGAREHILNDRPRLAVSVYHSNRDIYEIPRLISSIRDDYRYYLRSHGNQWAPSELSLYAL